MTQQKHTSGPIAGKDRMGPYVEWPSGERSWMPSEDDARRTAAAPELLAACQSVKDKLGDAEWMSAEHAEEILHKLVADEWPKLKAAIAKANGGDE